MVMLFGFWRRHRARLHTDGVVMGFGWGRGKTIYPSSGGDFNCEVQWYYSTPLDATITAAGMLP
ncbi:hypothetical protein YC2023_091217 [Brassica napus]